ncbi:MAG: O-antigen ligase family protein [Candidatus Eremiobacteraeota bacterium]|nr:O-antigen ligase family protein [Candidatus Eremiobacteraeota bacterium]
MTVLGTASVLPRAPQRATAPLNLVLLAFGFAAFPAYPAFITLSSVSPPGVSLIPRGVALALLACCALGALVLALQLFWERRPLPVTFGPAVAYIGAWLLAALFGFDPATGLLFVLDGVLVLIFHAAIARFYPDRRAALTMIAAFLGSGAFVAALGLGMLALRRPAAMYAVGHGRAISTFVVPGEFAGYLLFLIPTAIGVALVTGRFWLRVLGIAAAGLGLLALAATYSRAGWLGFAVGAAFFVYMLRRSARIGVLLSAALVVGLVTISVYNGHHNPSEYFTRLSIWRTGLRTVQLFPVTGVGPGAFRHVYPALRPPDGEPSAFHAHDYLLNAFAETGLVGIATLFALWYCFGRAMERALRGAQGSRRILTLAILSGFVATLAQSSLDFIQVVILGCWIPFMALALGVAEYGLE